ncbi:MAG TPA: 50S ribosomal protein L11 methyltransferase [Mucilaginibacter sp.]|nr:50S ribosomal protein L11 methyltransferase [Mucilaginibacter sp.]
MNYTELQFTTQPAEEYQQDLLINALSEIGFDTFEETDNGFRAYIPSNTFIQSSLDEILTVYQDIFPFSYVTTAIPQKNWNEVWESNFEPIELGDQIHVRASFHQAKQEFRYEIVIDPKMAFGTGHHQTTSMMLETMLETNFENTKVLDMGCGTGILAIMASKLGASEITAIDFDPVCYESTIENALLNAVENIEVICGSKEVIPDKQYHVILANINRNILLDQMARYNEALMPGGEICFSGFYEHPDLEIIRNSAENLGMKYLSHKKNNDWVAAKFVKKA